jgi:hypothetical protein
MSKSPDILGARTIPEQLQELRRPELPPETGWIRVGTTNPIHGGEFAPQFENGWQSDEDAILSFHLSESGEVRLRGKVVDGDYDAVVFTLPEGYRPLQTHEYVCAVVSATGYESVALDTIRFRAEEE